MSKIHKENHLLSIVSAIGGFQDILINGTFKNVYVPGDEAVDCLRDIKKLLRQDDTSKDKYVLRKLGHWKVVQNDLLPLLLSNHPHSPKVNSLIIELLVPLTWPMDMESQDLAGQLEHLKQCKEAFLAPEAIGKVLEFLLKLIQNIQRSERDNSKIRLVLLLFRNFLAIKDSGSFLSNSTEQEWKSTLQEQFIVKLHENDILSLFLSLAGSSMDREYQDWNLIILEIYYWIFIDRDIDDILSKNTALKELLSNQKETFLTKKTTSRHPRFGGTISISLASGKKLNVTRPLAAVLSLGDAFNKEKSENRVGFRKPKETMEFTKKRFIKDFKAKKIILDTAKSFVEHSFNALFLSAKRDFDIESKKVHEPDFSRFLWLSRFSLEFFRKTQPLSEEESNESIDFSLVAGIMNVRGFYFVFKRMNIYLDEKKYSELQITLECVKEMLLVLEMMYMSQEKDVQEISDAIQSTLFYEGSNIDLIVTLCKDHKPHSTSYLKTLVETTHQLLKMLENFSKSKGILYTRKKAAKVKKDVSKLENGDTTQNPDNQEDEEDVTNTKNQYIETEFKFCTIENKFALESVLSCYCTLLQQYQELDESTVWHITVMFHRIFIKCDCEALFYKLSVFELFKRIMSDVNVLPKKKGFLELFQFIKHVLRQFFKCVDKNPLVVIDLLYPKTKSDIRRIKYGDADFALPKSRSMFEDDNDEVEVEEELTWTEKVNNILKNMKRSGKSSMITWIEAELGKLVESRKNNDQELAISYEFEAEEDYLNVLLQEDEDVEQLFALFGFVRTVENIWTAPTALKTEDIEGYLCVLKPKSKSGSRRKERSRPDRSPNSKAAKEPEIKKYFIEDSDDDQNDEEFFKKEAENRRKWNIINSAALHAAPSIELESLKVTKSKIQNEIESDSGGSESDFSSENEKSDADLLVTNHSVDKENTIPFVESEVENQKSSNIELSQGKIRSNDEDQEMVLSNRKRRAIIMDSDED